MPGVTALYKKQKILIKDVYFCMFTSCHTSPVNNAFLIKKYVSFFKKLNPTCYTLAFGQLKTYKLLAL